MKLTADEQRVCELKALDRADDERKERAMNDAKHTKGPWRISDARDTDKMLAAHLGIPADCTVQIQGNVKRWPTNESYSIVAWVDTNRNWEWEVNARLIAAAPDLLEALGGLFEQCAMVHKHWGENSNTKQADDAIAFAQAAIAKAEGR